MAQHGTVPRNAELCRAAPAPIQNKTKIITYSVFCTKCLRLQNVVLPYCSHISLISNYQHWNFGITAKVSLENTK